MENLLNKKSFKNLNTKDLQQQQKHYKFIVQIMEDEIGEKFLATDIFYQDQKKTLNLISKVLTAREQKILFIMSARGFSSEFIKANPNDFIIQEYNKMSDEELNIEFDFYISRV